MMRASLSQALRGQWAKVRDILRDNGSALRLCHAKYHRIGSANEVRPVFDSLYIMATLAKRNGDCRWPHLIEQDLHISKRARSRRHAASARAASSSTR